MNAYDDGSGALVLVLLVVAVVVLPQIQLLLLYTDAAAHTAPPIACPCAAPLFFCWCWKDDAL